MSADSSGKPRRGIATSDLVDLVEDIAVSPSPTRAKRSARRLGTSAIAAAVAGIVAAGSLFGYAFIARGASQAELESANAEAAVPAAAQEAAELGFADRSSDVSRNAMREGIAEAEADTNAQERSEVLSDAADQALEAEAGKSVEERDLLMQEDLKLVEAQAAKLKSEAEEAAQRLKFARELSNKSSLSGSSAGVATLSEEEIANLSDLGSSMPIKSNYTIGSGFGQTGTWSRYHTGQDFPAPVGTPVYAVAAGVVLSSTSGSWAGTNVVIQHKEGATLYAHLSSKVVSTGQTVKPGQLIGYVGNTGRSFGAHLHFEFYKNGATPGDVYSASDPMTFLESIGAL